jgi:dTDP-4-dehydrorhamnose reductase
MMQREEIAIRPSIELWGGIECTVNRIRDRYLDQLESTGHATRPSDLELFARCGLSTVRYPVLWERTAPRALHAPDWRWSDARLGKLRDLDIQPIVGLVHHGSGPRYTALLDPAFPEKLADFAGAVARRYPWVDKFTPVNEPVTTARFSGLYGHWYPHARDDESFARMLMNECKGTLLAMRAIRATNPRAELIQTDDGGHTYSLPPLEYQATFDNRRRWLTFDILTGRLNPAHPLWDYLHRAGIASHEFEAFASGDACPNVIGLNYYVTSDRFLDHRIDRYPQERWGGNGRERYVDLEAVRVRPQGIYGHRSLLMEAWRRYQIPVALTEVHLGCTREEQLRWLVEAWEGAVAARALGADVRAVTAWSLFGATDWDSLVTRNAGHYESGVFDVRAPSPRPTALAGALGDLSERGQCAHPVLDTPGWWRRPSRVAFASRKDDRIAAIRPVRRPLLITGATGTLGRALGRACVERGLEYRLLHREDMDIADARSVETALVQHRPWAVINAAGYVRVDDAENDVDACYRENTTGPVTVARACSARGILLVTFSSDLVFSGRKTTPYVETDRPEPLSVYGKSKEEAERRVLTTMPRALVIRTSAFFGPWDIYNFLAVALETLAQGRPFPAANDMMVSPTYVPDLASACLDLLIDGEHGIWHLANDGALSWSEFARVGAAAAGLDPRLVLATYGCERDARAELPRYSVLRSERGHIMPSLENALARYMDERSARLAGGAVSNDAMTL